MVLADLESRGRVQHARARAARGLSATARSATVAPVSSSPAVPASDPHARRRRRPAGDASGSIWTNFEGPFDLLLGLISKHKLDVTEVALARSPTSSSPTSGPCGARVGPRPGHRVPRGRRDAARPQGRPAAARRARSRTRRTWRCSRRGTCCSRGCCSTARTRRPRLCSPRGWPRSPAASRGRWASTAVRGPAARGPARRSARRGSPRWRPRAMTPRAVPDGLVAHLHAPTVSVREQAAILVERLAPGPGRDVPGAVAATARTPLTVVARFLALLELYREGAVAFEQVTPLGELHVRWTGGRGRSRGRRRVRRTVTSQPGGGHG